MMRRKNDEMKLNKVKTKIMGNRYANTRREFTVSMLTIAESYRYLGQLLIKDNKLQRRLMINRRIGQGWATFGP